MKKIFFSLIFLLIVISGCNTASNPTETSEVADSTPNPTQTATSAPTPTITSIPTGTPTPVTLPTKTAEPTAEPSPSRTPFLGATATAEYNEAAILAAFEQYRMALFEQDGEKAIEVIDPFSFEWYEQILVDALTIDRVELDSKEFVEKFTLLRLRHEFSQEEIQNLSGEEIIIISIEKGWVGLETISELEIDEVIIATPPLAYITFKDLPFAASIPFIREGGRDWKISLSLLIRSSNEGFEQIIADSNLAEDEFIVSMLEQLSERTVDERIFDGPIE